MKKEEFIQSCKDNGLELTEKQITQYETYAALLKEWNEKMNLTAITEFEEVLDKHFYDSLLPSFSSSIQGTLCDVGSGAGFPSIPLKIAYPNLKVTIVDSLNKRITFLNALFEALGLENVEAVSARAEEYCANHRESFDIVTARAVAKNSILLEYSIPMLKIGGKFIAMKGNIQNESDYSNALKLLYSKQIMIEKFTLPIEESSRTLIMIEKQKSTSGKYPRNTNEIKKKPL